MKSNDKEGKINISAPWLMLLGLFMVAGIALLAGFIFVIVRFNPYEVNGESMSPTLTNGEYFLGSSRTKYERGDIIVYKSGKHGFIHRIAAMPGDEIRFDDDILYINNKPESLAELGLDKNTKTLTTGLVFVEGEDYVVPEEFVLLLGDNRGNARDSRFEGFIEEKEIFGVYEFSYWPPVKLKESLKDIN